MGFFRKSDEEEIQQQHDLIIEELKKKVNKTNLPDYVLDTVTRELELLSRFGPQTSEYSIGLAYIEYLISLPWKIYTEDNLDLERAQEILNKEHYGLESVKERILEHLAVKRLKIQRLPRILVVDDEEVSRKNLQYILSKENYTVATAANGYEAFDKMEKTEFDVILTDYKMEKIDGMEILEKTKVIYPSTSVIMITGYATVSKAVEAMKKGAFDYLAKPFKLEDVRDVVKKALERKTLQKTTEGSVICFSGPPGTGKTSMGRAIAYALGRKFSRISLGGVKDEAEIRGHRRTYAGAMPGRIIEEIRRTGSANPVLVLDELDKVGQDFKGDPASALLEVLDPEQNTKFMDHYVDLPFDLSKVMFIVTANVADNIIDALKDRMEIIEFSGYTDEEKARITTDYIIPRQIKETAISDFSPVFTEEAVYKIIQEYTYEAGIRNLNRVIASVCRKLAKEALQKKSEKKEITVDAEMVERLLGPRQYFYDVSDWSAKVGVTTGLVRTDVGGDIIFIEVARMKGKQNLILTGSLGEVMQESARIALSHVRSNTVLYGIKEDFFENCDIHVHVPAGAIPKDGPSAGTTIAVAIISLLTNRPVRRDVAISGELTLSGRILPVGGLKEKVLAAKRAKINTVVLPFKNRIDIESLPKNIRNGLEFVFVERMDEITEIALL